MHHDHIPLPYFLAENQGDNFPMYSPDCGDAHIASEFKILTSTQTILSIG